MRRFSNSPTHRAQGFSLIEILVGLAIGILGVIVMMQVFAVSEERKRTTTSAGESQSDGIMALYQLQSGMGQAGYGFSALGLLNCNIVLAAGRTPVPLAPVTINPSTAVIPAGDANSDRLLVMYGNGNGEPQGNIISVQMGNDFTVQMPSAFAVGDRVIVAPTSCAGNLSLDQVTATAASTVTVPTGASGGTMYNLGPSPQIFAYAVRGGNLTQCDYVANDCGRANPTDTSKWVPIASNIVSLRAQYGRDILTASPTVATPQVFAQVGTTWDQTTPINACNWTRIPAIRFVMVARSSQYDKDIVTAAAPAWAGSAANAIDLSAFANWQHYRYKVLQGVVPMRNIAWMGVPVGC